jgi:hypothetical protein
MSNPEERPVIKLDAQGVLDFILSSRYFKQLFANDPPDGSRVVFRYGRIPGRERSDA